MLGGTRLAVGTFTAVPVPAPTHVDPRTTGRALLLAPLVGVGLGLLAGGVYELVLLRAAPGGSGRLLAASAAVATMAAATRAIHLDGLADTADGLGSGRPADQALDIMRRSDIGPFGVVTLVLTLLLQITALAEAAVHVPGWFVLVAAGATSRFAVTLASPARAARPDGLGAAFAGVLRVQSILLVGLVVTAALGGAALVVHGHSWQLVGRVLLAFLAGCLASLALLRHCTRRLGGVTGDVFGALVETAGTVVLVALALL